MPVKASACLVSVAALRAAAPALAEPFFDRIAAFPVARNLPEGADPNTVTSAEILAASGDGMTLVYFDSPNEAIGFIDITDPAAPAPLGSLGFDGEPTSVSIRDATAFVGVNTRASFTEPSGRLASVDLATRAETPTCDLGGQPDSVAIAPDGSFIAVAIENERDENVNDGAIPQLPGGWVSIVPLADGAMQCDGIVRADLTGLAETAPEDPEPEFVDINANGEIAVTLQENNHVAVLDRTGKVLSHFSAGTVDLDGVDHTDDGALSFTESAKGVLREPDAIQWCEGDCLVTANEGDLAGGSRGFTIFGRDGTLKFESGPAFEQAIAAIGHYPEARSDAKGVEPEGLEFARFGDTDYLFVLSERASVVGVYRLADGNPTLHQLLPSGVSPEGATANPLAQPLRHRQRGRSRRGRPRPRPRDDLRSGRRPCPGLSDRHRRRQRPSDRLGRAHRPRRRPGHAWQALRRQRQRLRHAAAHLRDRRHRHPGAHRRGDHSHPRRPAGAEARHRGHRPDGEGGFWLASEVRSDRLIPHALIRVDAEGEIASEVPFPAELAATETRYGAEGVTVDADGKVWAAIQREWGDDPGGQVKLLAWDPAAETWGAVRYPLNPAPEGGWIGLSEITAHGDHLYLIERDNQVGEADKVKQITRVPLAGLAPAPLGGDLPLAGKEVVRDLLPDLAAPHGYIADKVEGFTIDAAGNAFAVTDNDGTDDSSGETHFLPLGALEAM